MQKMFSRIFAVLITAGVLASLTACSDGNASESVAEDSVAKEYVVNVKVEKIAPTEIIDKIMLPGETEAMHDVDLAAEQEGLIEWVGITEGDHVTTNQQLVRVDGKALAAARDRAEATLAMEKHQLLRREKLFKSNVLSREELEQAENEYTIAETQLREAEVHYANGIVTAPVSGVINYVAVDEGEFVSKGSAIATIVNVDIIKITFSVPEMDVRYLTVGQKAPVSFDAYRGEEWEGTVDFVAWKADPATRTFPVRIIVENKDGRIRPGMIARANFVRRTLSDVVSIPLFSVIDKGGERIVFVEKDGVAVARTVQLGVIEGDRVQILGGLNVGDHLIVAGHRTVEDGTKVNVR